MKYIYKNLTLGLITFFPIFAFAEEKKDLKYLASLFASYLNVAIQLIIGLAVVVFVWNVFQYFFTEKDKEKKEAGMYVFYSIIGFFVILSFWGMVAVVRNSLKLEDSIPRIPTLDFNASGNSGTTNTGTNNTGTDKGVIQFNPGTNQGNRVEYGPGTNP
jgi:uncharacterized membrane protein YuzA (DUF378 family)